MVALKRTGLSRKGVLFGVVATICLVLVTAPLAYLDLRALGHNSNWSSFEKTRVKLYLETAGLIGFLVPPIGKLPSAIHHGATAGDAYLDGNYPSMGVMRFFRRVLLDSYEHDEKKGFRARFQAHEDKAMSRWESNSRKKQYVRHFKQKVQFDDYAHLQISDSWEIVLRTDVVDGKPKSSFCVCGMGIVEDERGPAYFGNQINRPIREYNKSVKNNSKRKRFTAWLASLDFERELAWINRVEQEELATPYWVLLTELDETSEYSHDAVKQKYRKRVADWHERVDLLLSNGGGVSVKELYER